MKKVLAFDVYGTLIDPHGVVTQLEAYVGNDAVLFSSTWRQKQLEYTFRRGLMRSYQDFTVCTSNALDYTCEFLKLSLSNSQKQLLLQSYQKLPAYSDVNQGLEILNKNFDLYAFSNGEPKAVDELLCFAGIRNLFKDIVTTSEVSSFKPNPDVYHHLLERTGSSATDTWLISSNPLDVIGALSIGLQSAWIKRSNDAVFDPWGIEPTLVSPNLADLALNIS